MAGRGTTTATTGSSVATVAIALTVVFVAAGAGSSWPPAPNAVVVPAGGCSGGAYDDGRAGRPRCFESIGAALFAAPGRPGKQHRHQHRYVILITQGVYEERVNVTRNNVALIGEGVGRTIITGNRSNATQTGTDMTATVSALGDGFLAQNLTIRNTAGPDGRQAVALRSNSNRSVVYGCRIEGYEDSLWAENGLQLYLDTEILGTVDFIFGNAKAVFQRCKLLLRKPLVGKHNVITAQGCNDPRYEESGFSFHKCTVDADPAGNTNLTGVESFLGRPYKIFSHVVFMQCNMSAVVSPSGWVSWQKGREVKETSQSVRYMEYANEGDGANTSQRVAWPGFHVLVDAAQAEKYCVDSFIAGNEWIPRQIPYVHKLD